jgi:Spy/CpxP family protein refolding chaperone
MKTLLAGLMAASSLAIALPAAQAQPMEQGRAMHAHQMRGGGMDGRGGMGMLRGLDLTEAQRDQVFKIFHAEAPAMRERMKATRAAQEELRKASAAQSFDSARVRQLADAVGKAHADAAYARAETMSRVLAVLTPEQRTKLNERREHGPRRGPRS